MARIHKQYAIRDVAAVTVCVAIALGITQLFHPFGYPLAWFTIFAFLAVLFYLKRRKRTSILLMVLAGTAVFIVPLTIMNGHVVPLDKLDSIVTRKASMNEVVKLIGHPKSKTVVSGCDVWRYSGLTWCIVEINFDEAGNAVAVSHDH